MKKITYLFIALVIALGCSKSDKDEDRSEEVATLGLSLDSAIAYSERYQRVALETLHMAAPIRGFSIRSQDLLQAMGLPKTTATKYPYARIYIGLDSDMNFRGFLMPVEKGDRGYPGRDVVMKGKYENAWLRGSRTNAIMEGKYVFDFTMPCPSSCDPESPIPAINADTTAIAHN